MKLGVFRKSFLWLAFIAAPVHAAQVDVYDYATGKFYSRAQMYDAIRLATKSGPAYHYDSDNGCNPEGAESYVFDRQRPTLERVSGSSTCVNNSVTEAIWFGDVRVYSYESGITYDRNPNIAGLIRISCDNVGPGYVCQNGACVAPSTAPGPTIQALGRLPEGISGTSSIFVQRENTFYVFGPNIYSVSLSAPAKDAIQLNPEQFTPHRAGAAVVYDEAANVAYIFGGVDPATRIKTDLISKLDFNAPRGSRLTDIGRLNKAKSTMAAAFDPGRGVAVIFGGIDGGGHPTREIVQVDLRGAPAVTVMPELLESAIFSQSAVYEPTTGKIYVSPAYGGVVNVWDPSRPSGQRYYGVATLPAHRDYMWMSTGAPGQIILGGGIYYGSAQDEVYRVDTRNGVVTELPPQPEAVAFAKAARDRDGIIFIFGGSDTQGERSSIMKYLLSGTSSGLGELASGPASGVPLVYNGRYFLAFTNNGIIEKIDPTLDLQHVSQITLDRIPGGIQNAAVVRDENSGLIYIFGGMNITAAGRQRYSTIYVYDSNALEGQRVSQLPDTLPGGRSSATGIFFGGKILLFGGVSESGTPMSQILQFDPRGTPKVTTLSVSLPVPVAYPAVATNGSNIIISGVGNDQVYEYSVSSSSIRSLGTLSGGMAFGANMIYSSIRGQFEMYGWSGLYGVVQDLVYSWDWNTMRMVQEDIVLTERAAYLGVAQNPTSGEILTVGGSQGVRELSTISIIK